MKQVFFLITLFMLSLAALTLSVISVTQSPKIAYVRSAVVIESYAGMKEAKKSIENKIAGYQSQLDTLGRLYQKKYQQYESEKSNLSQKQQEQTELELQAFADRQMKYQQQMEEKATKERDRITQGALNQINAYVERYAERKGYDMVFGATLSGNILYGNKATDITNEIVEGLNSEYR